MNNTIETKEYIKGFFGKNRWLSNFYICKVFEFDSSEAAYQSWKTIKNSVRNEFINLSPYEAKQLGRNIMIRKDWDSIKIKVMEKVLREKFKDIDLKKKLLETGDKYLEETNNWGDKFWGVSNNIGENHLGKLLMKIREEIKQENQNVGSR